MSGETVALEPCCIVVGWCKKCEAIVCWGHHKNAEGKIDPRVLGASKEILKTNDITSNLVTHKHED